jgi:hypothetical protein
MGPLIVIGAAAVPAVLVATASWYSPALRVIVVPAVATSRAFCSVLKGAASVPGLVSRPDGATQ